jgi:hypothetical protein
MPIDLQITIAALLVQAFGAASGVFFKRFDDNIIQRIGLFGVSITSLALAWYIYKFHSALMTFEIHAGSWAVYILGTAWKFRKVEHG